MKHIKKFELNEKFNFEDFDETDIAGPSMEIMIDNLIDEAKERIESSIPPENEGLRIQARIAIKQLWHEKIKEWR